MSDWLHTLDPDTVRIGGMVIGMVLARWVMDLDPPPGGWT